MGLGEHRHIHGREGDAAHQIGDEYQLFGEVAVPLAAAAGGDVAQKLAAEGGDDRCDDRQPHGIPDGLAELGVVEDASVAGVVGRQLLAGADPVIEREIFETVARAGVDLEGLHDQHEHRHNHREEQKQQQEDHQRNLGLAEAHFGTAPALAADGGVAFANADDALVGKDDEGGQGDQNDAHREAHVLGAAVDEVLHLGGQREVADAVAEVGRHAVGADGLGQGHDHGGQHTGQHQGDGDGLEDLGLGRAADLAHLLQLGVDGA